MATTVRIILALTNDRLSNLIYVQHVWPLDVYACPSINVQHTVEGAMWSLVCMRVRLLGGVTPDSSPLTAHP